MSDQLADLSAYGHKRLKQGSRVAVGLVVVVLVVALLCVCVAVVGTGILIGLAPGIGKILSSFFVPI
jgi:hypothetical protein